MTPTEEVSDSDPPASDSAGHSEVYDEAGDAPRMISFSLWRRAWREELTSTERSSEGIVGFGAARAARSTTAPHVFAHEMWRSLSCLEMGGSARAMGTEEGVVEEKEREVGGERGTDIVSTKGLTSEST